MAIILRMERLSYLDFTSSGSLQTIRMGVGAAKVVVTLYFSTSLSQSSGSNFRCTRMVLPSRNARPMNPPGPE